MIGGGTSEAGWDKFDWDEEATHGPNWDNFDWATKENKVKLEDLVILHFEGVSAGGTVSNKVWGRFQMDGTWRRFWGKSTASVFQTTADTKMTVLETQDKKMKKGYGKIDPDSRLFKDVAHVLECQFGISLELLRSLVTGEKVERPIKPSEVVATRMEGNVVVFWDEQGEIIGSRTLDQWDKIREHMERSKFVKKQLTDGTHHWAEKTEEA